MRITITYDPAIDAWTAKSYDAVLRTQEAVDSWSDRIELELAKLGGRRYLLVDLNGLEVEMRVKEAFGRAVRDRLLRHAAAVRFFGQGAGFTSTILMLESVKGPATMRPLASRAEAAAELARLRRRRSSSAGAVANAKH